MDEKTPPVSLTPAAAKRLVEISGSPEKAVLIGLKSGGCAGMSYTMDVVDRASTEGERIEREGACLIIDPVAEIFLFGMEIDFKTDLVSSGFTFTNPNASASCGCGTSVGFSL